MQWIRRGRQLGQAVKNAQRLRQIVTTFAKYGFVDFLERLKLDRLLPRSVATFVDAHADLSPAIRFRMALEELGPTFVKFGQLLSTRPDVMSDAFVQELSRLLDHVSPIPIDSIRQVIREELGADPEQLFSEFDPEPLASASISQVHRARLESADVVVKVQRPGIKEVIETDVSLLGFIAELTERYIPESRAFQPKILVDELFRTITLELDFQVEANNMTKISENMSSIPEIIIPRVYAKQSTKRVLTLERLHGIPMNDLEALSRAGVDRKRLVEIGVRAFFKSVLIDGIFHGDLHGGNLFVLPNGQIGIIDFGIVGRLSQRARDQLANMVLSLVTEDYENLCYQYAELGDAASGLDFEGFQREVRNAVAPYVGLTAAQLNAGLILTQATRIAVKYRIKVPGDWMVVFRAMLTTEGMARALDPDFDMLALGDGLIQDLVKDRYSVERLTKDFTWFAKDLSALLQALPRQLRFMLKKFNSNDFAVEIRSRELEEIRDQLDTHSRRGSLSILTAGCLVAGALALQHDQGRMIAGYPIVSVVLVGFGLVLSVRLLIDLMR